MRNPPNPRFSVRSHINNSFVEIVHLTPNDEPVYVLTDYGMKGEERPDTVKMGSDASYLQGITNGLVKITHCTTWMTHVTNLVIPVIIDHNNTIGFKKN